MDIPITILQEEELLDEEPVYLPYIIIGCIGIYITVIYFYPQFYIPYYGY